MMPVLIFIGGVIIGAWARRSPKEDINLIEENTRLRNEIAVLWRKIDELNR